MQKLEKRMELSAGQHATYKGKDVMIHGFRDGQVKIKYYTASGRAAIKTVDAKTLSNVHENPIAQHAGRV